MQEEAEVIPGPVPEPVQIETEPNNHSPATGFGSYIQTPVLKSLLLDRLLSDLCRGPVVDAGEGWQPALMPVVDTYIMRWDHDVLVSDDFRYTFEVKGLPPPHCARGENLESRTLKLRLLRWTFQVVPSGSACDGSEEPKVCILARQWAVIAADYDFLVIDIIPPRIETTPGLKHLILTVFVAESTELQTAIKSKKSKKAKNAYETPQSDGHNRSEAASEHESQQTSRFGIGNTESDYSFKETPEQPKKSGFAIPRVLKPKPRFMPTGSSMGMPGLSVLELLSGTVLGEEIDVSSAQTSNRPGGEEHHPTHLLERAIRYRSRSKSKKNANTEDGEDVISLSSDARQAAGRQKRRVGFAKKQPKKVEVNPFLPLINEAIDESKVETNSLSGMSRAQTCQRDLSKPKKLRVTAMFTSSAEKPGNLNSKLRDRERLKRYVRE